MRIRKNRAVCMSTTLPRIVADQMQALAEQRQAETGSFCGTALIMREIIVAHVKAPDKTPQNLSTTGSAADDALPIGFAGSKIPLKGAAPAALEKQEPEE